VSSTGSEFYLRPKLAFELDATVTIKSLQVQLALPHLRCLSYAEANFVRQGLRTQYRVIPVIFFRDTIRVIRRSIPKHTDNSHSQPSTNHAYSNMAMDVAGEHSSVSRM